MCALLLRMLPVILGAAYAGAQVSVAGSEATGSVSGHVYCADTNLPARFATVSLEPVEVGPERPLNGRPVTPTVKVVQTRLDGGFAVAGVKPGTYYVVVQKLGYPSPIQGFSLSDLAKPTAALAQRIAKSVPMVMVGAGQAASVEVRIERGAAIAGRVVFDDGSPAADVTMMALRQRSGGLWGNVEADGRPMWAMSSTRTDDQGRFRVLNLPPGEFLLEAEFQLNESTKSSMFETNASSIGGSGGMDRLTVYAGNVFRQTQAARIKLEAAEERPNEEIVVSLSKLHLVSGTLVNRSGAVVNGGMVLLFDGAEKMPQARAEVGKDGAFHFSFVPEGTYRLDAYGVDLVPAQVPAAQAAGTGVITQGNNMVKMYGWQRQTLLVQNDVTGLVVTLPDATPKAMPVQ